MKSGSALLAVALVAALASMVACSSSSSKTPTTCDPSCQDDVAVRGLRDAVKLAFNLLLQGQPVGTQDTMVVPCPLGGMVQVHGTATSVAEQGTTMLTDLTYDFEACGYSETDTDPTKTFSLTLTGSVVENGNLANDPSSTTAITLDSDALSITGTVFSPGIQYGLADGGAESCSVHLGQNGDDVSGTVCAPADAGADAGRMVGVSL